MSTDEFDDLFGVKKKTPTQREPTPTISPPIPTQRESIPSVREPVPTEPKAKKRPRRTSKIDLKKMTEDIVSQVTENLTESLGKVEKYEPDKSLQKIIGDLGMQVGTLKAELKILEPLKDKIWNEVNRLKWMNSMTRPDKKGFKKVEMERYFSSEDVKWSDIDSIIEEYKKIGLLKTSRNGWMRLTPKGKEHYQNLLEAKE